MSLGGEGGSDTGWRRERESVELTETGSYFVPCLMVYTSCR